MELSFLDFALEEVLTDESDQEFNFDHGHDHFDDKLNGMTYQLIWILKLTNVYCFLKIMHM